MVFDEVYNAYWQKVYRICMGYVNDHDWAKDIAQETFMIVLQELSKFRNEASVGTWIFRIASNQCLKQLERQNRMPKTNVPETLAETSLPDTERQVEFLYKCISELPETDRIIISLELEDVRQADIAQIVGISETNVRVRIHRIKEKLTSKFAHYEQ